MKKYPRILSLLFLLIITNAFAQEKEAASAEELAKKLANPAAALISVPLQNNFDFSVGPLEGFRYTLNLQPVIPFSIGEKWNVISRAIVPIISQSDVTGPNTSEAGLGDTMLSFYFSPKEPKNGIVWGVGPILVLPTATEDVLGFNKWGAGPNALIVKLQGPLTYGGIVNHTWSYAGDGLTDINATFIQPFFTYSNKTGGSYTIASENTQSWDNDIFGGFVGVYAAQILKLGPQLVQFALGPKVYYGNNFFNPDWGIRANVTLLFPN